ncbi:hypothetical protein [Bradyrhizobium zhanjiangense]|uniref:hypothetical protein n=1 Tax=Bradyrhizobium zhanjiangense TaxID=1325107 RepID=UPI001008EA3C|nr:hypothetical protein [Bradyrhizobium zhanjiangense]
MLRRIAPENHAEMEERLVDEMGEEFQTRLNQRLTKEGPTGYADAERAVGSQMIAREIKTELMQWVFGTHGIEL